MQLFVEKEANSGQYGLIDTLINEDVNLNTKTTYVIDITAVFKGFTNSFAVQATPNNIKLLGYFGYTESLTPARTEKRAKLLINGLLYKEGVITIENVAYVNETPNLYQLSFSDGLRNLTDILGEDTLFDLGSDGDGNISWDESNLVKALQSIQNGTNNVRWFVPLVSNNRIFSIDGRVGSNQTDNIYYVNTKSVDSENILLKDEIRPAMFIEDIIKQINKKYSINISPTAYPNSKTQLTDLAVLCTAADVATKTVKVEMTKSAWTVEFFREERFDIILKPLIQGFELNYLGYGTGSAHDGTFGMAINLFKSSNVFVDDKYVRSLEVWVVDSFGNKKEKLKYTVADGAESGRATLRINIGLDVFTPDGVNSPSTLQKPLICVFAAVDNVAGWTFTDIKFDWHSADWQKGVFNNVQTTKAPTTVNLFQSLAPMKVIDFVKSVYTMFAYKKFDDNVLNDFYYKPKTTYGLVHNVKKVENDLTPYADLSKMTKKNNTKYDGYNLKHATSEYQQNISFLNNPANNGQEYGQLKYPFSGKPKSEFLVETKFTVPVFNPIITDADDTVYSFYPFGSESKLNETATRFIYTPITKEMPIFYYQGVSNISTPYAFVDFILGIRIVKSIGKYHKIRHRSINTFTGTDNYISSLFNIISGDYLDQNTLYVMGFKDYVEGTISGKKLIHTIDLELPSKLITKGYNGTTQNTQTKSFEDSQEIIIKETRYTVLESTIKLNDGKTQLILLNK